MNIPASIRKIASFLENELGAEMYLVGGASRNLLIDTDTLPKDYDCVVFGAVTNDIFEIVQNYCEPSAVLGNENHYPFIVYTDNETGCQVEITVPRLGESNLESPYITLHEDAKRRALTIDAIYINVLTYVIVSPIDSALDDLFQRYARPCDVELFTLDVNRVALVLKKVSQYTLTVTNEMIRAIEILRPELIYIPKEVLGTSLLEAIRYNFFYGFRYLADCDILGLYAPLGFTYNFDQNNPHHEELLHTHLLNTLEEYKRINSTATDAELLAALFHDVGKPFSCQVKDNGYYSYIGHEDVSAAMAKNFLMGLAIPKDTVLHACELIRFHMRLHYLKNCIDDISPSTIMRLMSKFQHIELRELMALTLADSRSKIPAVYSHPVVVRLGDMIKFEQFNLAENVNEYVMGRHIIESDYDIPPGPVYGVILHHANSLHIDYPELSVDVCLKYGVRKSEFEL